MQALVYTRRGEGAEGEGSPWAVVQEHPRPVLTSPTQVLVRVRAAGLNPVDSKIRSGWLDLVLRHLPVPGVPGLDFAGVVEETMGGSGATEGASGEHAFRIGDPVYGKLSRLSSIGHGTSAQWVVVDVHQDCIQPLPPALPFQDAATIGVAALTAYTGLVIHGKLSVPRPVSAASAVAAVPEPSPEAVHPRKHVLIVGASGGVGVWAVRLAKFLGTHVSVVCSARNEAYVRALGADIFLDYTSATPLQEQWRAHQLPPYDVVLDCVGGDDYWRTCLPMLRQGGVYSTAVGHLQHGGRLTVGALLTLATHLVTRNVPWLCPTAYRMILLLPNDPFRQLHEWLASGSLEAVPAHHIFPLLEGPKAMELLDSHRASGKVVLVLDAA